MLNLLLKAFLITLGLIGPAMAQERILISSELGKAMPSWSTKLLDR